MYLVLKITYIFVKLILLFTLGRNTEENNNVIKETSPLKKEDRDDANEEEKDEAEKGARECNKDGEGSVAKRRRKRRQVMKAKQYIDEEGFMGKMDISFFVCQS